MLSADIADNPAGNGQPCGRNATLSSPISADGTAEPGRLYTVTAREGRAVRLARSPPALYA